MRTGILILIISVLTASCSFGFEFAPGDLYTTGIESRTITQHDQTGGVRGAITLPIQQGEFLHGMAFGPDDLLYVSTDTAYVEGFRVRAISESGETQRSYSGTGYLGGSLDWGKIAFDGSGHFYLGGYPGLMRFDVADTSSCTCIWNTPGFGVNDSVLALASGLAGFLGLECRRRFRRDA